jgi:serine/threonine protein kinase/tetratricopeptide (TPR) repeat protein
MICPACGRNAPASEAVCTACGAVLADGATIMPPVSLPKRYEHADVTQIPMSAADGATIAPTGGGTGPLSSADGATIAATAGGTGRPSVRSRMVASAAVATPPPAFEEGPPPAPPASDDTGPLKPGAEFGSRYHIIRILGVGGMGAVYQAWDAELGVAVAIKVIRAELAQGAEVERRFKRELLLARQVTHKNVVRIHDLGEIDGIKYITMPYVDGADLGSVLKRDGQLPVPRVLRIARSVVSGLVAAHKADVVHRDLKPANIMIGADDEAMIMDFGIARSTGNPTTGALPGENTIVRNLRNMPTNVDATVFGAVVGTVDYMAPEQAKGIAVDQRADVYAFGLILYDLLTGRRRLAESVNPIAELQERMKHAPPAIKSILPDVPVAVDELVGRCIEPDADKRFQTSEELATALALLDDEGIPIPIPARFSKKLIATAATVVLALVTATWYLTRTPPAPKQHDPVTVMIADFENTTGDSTFDHTLEPMVRLALEGAGFISAYDRNRVSALGISPPDKMNAGDARELAVKQGVGVVLAGSIAPRGTGYDIGIKAIQPLTGKVLTAVDRRAASKNQVLETATNLVSTVRKVLGDSTTSEAAQVLAMRSISSNSLEVAGYYAAALEAQYKTRYEEARQNYLKAIEKDPKFGLGYQGLAAMSLNLRKLQDAEKYSAEALRFLDGMTERERFSARGFYYQIRGDLAQCVKEYGDVVAKYPADATAHNQRAICFTRMRNMRSAMDEMRLALQILPNRMAYRGNLALFAAYAGDFATAEREVRAVQKPTSRILFAQALTQLGQGRLQEATDTYQKMRPMDAFGASYSASGLADLALYQGRFSDAVRIFEESANADLTSKNLDSAAMKLTSIAYAHLMHGQKALAIAAADKALQNSTAMHIRFLAGRILAEAGAVAKARPVADGLASEVPSEPQTYGKIIQGEIALNTGDAAQARKILTDANGLVDTWLGHFDLGRAYLALKAFPQADSEFDRCIQRRGEALALFDAEPTYGYFPPVYYYQGRAREGIGTASFADAYRVYLNIRGKSNEDPLLAEVRKKLAN